MCPHKINGISAQFRVLGPEQIFQHTFWSLQWRRQQNNQTHIGPHEMWDLIKIQYKIKHGYFPKKADVSPSA